MKKVLFLFAIVFAFMQASHAQGLLSSIYLNPNIGDDNRDGSLLYPVRTWNKALSLAANNATIYITGGTVAVTSNMTIDGNQYGATGITATPYTGYTGSLFTIASGATGSFSNITLKGTGTAQALLSANSGGTITIGSDVSITDMGQVSLDGGAHPVNLTATPPPDMNYRLSTTYSSATDEGRIIVDAGSVSSPLQHFTLTDPQSTASAAYELVLDGSAIRLYELPVGGIYLDPLNGNDGYSGAKSSRPLKTLDRAIALWNSRNTASPGLVTDIFVLTRITLSGNLTLDNGVTLTRFTGNTDRPASMTDDLLVYTGYEVTLNHATIKNGTISGRALFSASNGILRLNDGATVTSGNTSNIIQTESNGVTVLNAGSAITNTGTSGYCIYDNSNSSSSTNSLTINGGTIVTSTLAINKSYGTMAINGGVITHTGNSNCIYMNNVTAVFTNCNITTTGTSAIYNYYYSNLTIESGSITNLRTSAGNTIYNYYYSTLTINGGTIDGGLTSAIYCTNSVTALNLNGGTVSSSNTLDGTIFIQSVSAMRLNGENFVVANNGIITMASTAIETYFMTVTSPTVTQNYTLRVVDGMGYGALVKSNPVMDLGQYISRFTLEPKAGYLLAAYGNKGEPKRNLILYDSNGVYVNDYTGNDANTGLSPDLPVKTLANAAGKTAAGRTSIYICDSTLTINSAQTITPSSPRDTIKSLMFRNNAYLIRITADTLTLQNIAIYAPSVYTSQVINIENGGLRLNTGAAIFTYNAGSGPKYGIYQTGGKVFMNDGSKIAGNPASPTSMASNAYGIYKTGNASTLEIGNNVLIERQYYFGIYNSQGNATIGEAILQYNATGSSSYSALYVGSGTVVLNGTVIQNNTYRALYVYGNNAVVTMTDGLIANNGGNGLEGAVYIQNQGVFNFLGGKIEKNNTPTTSTTYIYGEQIYITSGGRMNFTGGTVTVSGETKNAIYVQSTATTQVTAGHLTLSDQAVLDSGYIYCSSPYFAPIDLSNSLSPGKKFNINVGDNMAGCVIVNGTSPNTPASVSNFVLNPTITAMYLVQNGDNVIVGSTAIYLDGTTNGNDAYDGSSASRAVRTFARARSIMQANPGSNLIVIIGATSLNNAGEISNWDLSFNPDALVQRGLGYTGYLVTVPNTYHLTLSDITLDGNRENVNNATGAIVNVVSGGKLTIESGAVIRNNFNDGVNMNGSCYMNGGEISNNRYGFYGNSSSSRSDEFIMRGGKISDNTSYGVYITYLRYFRMFGGEISRNRLYGVYNYYIHTSGVMEIGGTAKITGNLSSGVYYYSGTTDSLIISGGEISNNAGMGLYQYANHVSITGGLISGNTSSGLSLSTSASTPGTTVSLSGMTITGNVGYGAVFANFADVSMTDGVISGNTGGSYGLSLSGSSTLTGSRASITGGSITGNANGLSITNYETMTVTNTTVSNNNGAGITVSNPTISLPGVFSMSSGDVSNNNGFGFSLSNYLTYSISGNVQITENKSTGVYSNSLQPSSISGDVLIRGNRSLNTTGGYAGGLYVNQGTVNISGNVTFEADTSTYFAGGIYVGANGNAVISGNVQIKDCRNLNTTTTVSYGGTAIYALGKLSMTGGSITGCETAAPAGTSVYGRGTVFVSGASGNVSLTKVIIRDNKAGYGGAVFVNSGGRITLDTDTIRGNTTYYNTVNPTTAYTTPASGDVHLTGGATGRLSVRDRCIIEGDFFISSRADTIYIDEALLTSDVGVFHLLAANPSSNPVTTPGTVVVSPNGSTVTDASQFLKHFTLMNLNIGRGLDKGGTDDKHIMIVNQFFIDGTRPDGGNGSSPYTAFNSLTQAAFTSVLNTAYSTVWVSGPVKTKQAATTLPVITTNHVNIRRYTGFAVAAQPFAAYDSVMITVEPGHTLTIEGGNSAANTFTISGEGGSSLYDASIFKNNGTLTLRGHINLFFNPIPGKGAAVYQNGTFNLSGNVSFNLYSPNTVYLPEGKVIAVPAPLNTTTPVGITVETSPVNTHIPGRFVVAGTTTNVPPGLENLFYNEIPTSPLPIGRTVNGVAANLMFYVADRNVSGVPVYATLQEAFDMTVPAANEEVRLYGNTKESVAINKQLRYNSQGFSVLGSFTLDSLSCIQLLDDLLADTLFIRATTFSNKAQLDLNTRATRIAKTAYFDLTLPQNAKTGDWYPVNLPFDAQVSDIRDASDTSKQVIYLQDFGIAAFDTQRRALYGIGNQPSNPNNDWQFLTQPTLANGAGYMVTAESVHTLRFKADNLNLFSTAVSPLTLSAGPTTPEHHGLNYVAQPLSMNASINGGIPYGSIVQVSESLSSDRIGAASYVPKYVNTSLVIAPYTNYFYQTDMNGAVTYTPTTNAATVRSGALTANSTTVSSGALTTNATTVKSDALTNATTLKSGAQTNNAATVRSGALTTNDVPAYYELRLYGDDPSQYDALFAAAHEYASKDRYEIGRDVIKMGTLGGHALQIWSTAFDVALCANEVLIEDGLATIPLFIHTPVAGKEYQLKLQNTVSDREQLWLCLAGKPIQNLTAHPVFTLTGTGYTTGDYSLRITNGTTSNRPVETGDVHVYAEHNAIIINGMQPGNAYLVYDLSGRLHATGKATGNQTKIYTDIGVYVVQVKDNHYKVIVY